MVAGLVAVLAFACIARADAPAPAADCSGCAAWGHPLAWGAWFDDSVPKNLRPVRSFAHDVGQRMSVIQFGAAWAHCSGRHCRWFPFPSRNMRIIWNRGAIPMLSWSSQSIPSSLNEPDFRLSRIAAGAYDTYLHRWARSAAHWGHPFFMRFDWEMNGNWFPWGQRINHNSPGDFVAAWRHVHDIFAAEGATSVTWVWCPNTDNKHVWFNMPSLYPGSPYVDWTCLDGYNFGPLRRGAGGWQSFHRLFRSSYHLVVDQIAPGKPMVLGEVASVGKGGSRAAWISHMFADIPKSFPLIHGVVWFQRRDGILDWPIPSRSPSAQAFASGVRTDQSGGALCPRTRGPIAPPAASAASCG